ncbi:MAG: phage holin [Coriobacteriales bacterium]|jgi:hypothetical protein|nr:phage holin [Coriobacteriales bacterium]
MSDNPYLLPDKAYKALKWIALVVLPAIGLAYNGLASVWGLPYGSQVLETTAVVEGLIGALIGVSAIKAAINK